MKQFIQQCFFVLMCGAFISCASKKYVRDDLSFSFNRIQSTIKKHLPEGISWMSTNQREIRSQYFRPGIYKKEYQYNKNKKEIYRAKARVWILGSRRPYRLILRVYIEKNISKDNRSQTDLEVGDWVYIRQDGGIAKRLGNLIHKDLVNFRRNWDLIDNFRPY